MVALDDLLYFVRIAPGPDTLAKYRASCRDNRRLFRALGPSMGGRVATARAIGVSLAKEQVFRVATALGRQEALLKRRSRAATRVQEQQARAALARVSGARVPGLDP